MGILGNARVAATRSLGRDTESHTLIVTRSIFYGTADILLKSRVHRDGKMPFRVLQCLVLILFRIQGIKCRVERL